MDCTSPIETSDGGYEGSTLGSRAAFLLNNNELSDVRFIFEEEGNHIIIHGHKLILGISSVVFNKMFYNSHMQNSSEEIDLRGHLFNSNAFLDFLKFIYTDKLELEGAYVGHIIGIIHCSDFFQVRRLIRQCVLQLNGMATLESVMVILNAGAALGHEDLTNIALDFIDWGGYSVLEALSKPLLSVSQETLIRIVSRDTFEVPEFCILQLCQRWASKVLQEKGMEITSANQRVVLGRAFYEIRYALLPSMFVVPKLLESNFLTEDEYKETLPGCQPVVFKKHSRRGLWLEADLFMRGIRECDLDGSAENLEARIAGFGFTEKLLVSRVGGRRFGNSSSYHVRFLYDPRKNQFDQFLQPIFWCYLQMEKRHCLKYDSFLAKLKKNPLIL